MTRYILSRLLWAFPTLFLISLISFWISNLSATDPLEKLLRTDAESVSGNTSLSDDMRKEWQKKLFLDKPAFYFSLQPLAFPDTLHRVVSKSERKVLRKWLWQSGDWPWVVELNGLAKAIPLDQTATHLRRTEDLEQIEAACLYNAEAEYAQAILSHLAKNPKRILPLCIPKLKWHGLNNRYHLWAANFVRGDMGYSLTDGQSISKKIGPKVKISLSISLSAILLSILVALPLGLWSGYKPWMARSRAAKVAFIALYSMPSFVVATLLLFIFSNPGVLHILPGSGLSNPLVYRDSWSIFQKMAHHLPYLVLPIVSYALVLIAVMGRLVQQSTAELQQAQFMVTAKAKGLPNERIRNVHALRNVLLPVITLAFGMLPVALGGSVIIETIFSIPGMGREIYRAMLEQDHNLVVAVFTLVGALTVLGYLLADIFYAWADPRIRYSEA
jgi:peptide/nickel transport system permease protein